MKTTRFTVDGMDCASCALKIDTVVRRLPGIDDVSVSVQTGLLLVSHGETADLAPVSSAVSRLGYGIAPAATPDHGNAAPSADHAGHDHAGHDHAGHAHSHAAPVDGRWWQGSKALTTLACGLLLAGAFVFAAVWPAYARHAYLVAMGVGLVPILRRALGALLAGMPFTIEMLMTVAAIGAVFIDASEEAAVVVFLFLLGELLEGIAAGRARRSIRALGDLVPRRALVETETGPVERDPERLLPGDLVLVRPGDRIAADGVIVEGDSAIDEAPVTGESVPVPKAVGAEVYAGTVNGDGALRLRVTRAAADNTIARIIALVESAQQSKSPTERFIDRFSFWYTPAVLAAGALVALVPPLLFGGDWDSWIYKGLAVLLIGCPCALVISTPAAIAAALASGARRGLLMKGGAVLEKLGHVTAVALDKTGTLTVGKPVVTDVVGFGADRAAVLSVAASLEQGSSHPLALAILARAAEEGLRLSPASDARAENGKGLVGTVEGTRHFLGSVPAADARGALDDPARARLAALAAEGKSVSVLLAETRLLGAIAMRDEPRPDARAGLEALAARGIGVTMLTGDNPQTAAAIAGVLGLEDVRAGLLPEDKQRIVGELQRLGRTVAKVGDGINDAPALAAADIGIAMGGGTDVALETADAAILHGRVGDIAAMIDLSRATMRNIHQNIAIALGLKAVFLVTTLLGITGLWPAILADTGATVLVTANALRLLAPPR